MADILDNIDVAGEVFKSLVWDVYLKKIIYVFVTGLGLSVGGLPAVAIAKVVTHYAEKAYPYFIKIVKVGSIVLSNPIHQRSYELAQYKLKVIAIESGINSDAFKNEKKIAHDKQSKLVIYNIQYS